MRNQTLWSELYLLGMSDVPSLQLLLFLIFFYVYVSTLVTNLLIILLVVVDSHLHSPMYFFLGNLACLDMGCSSITSPRLLYDLTTNDKTISVAACMSQVFFFIFFATCEILLLAVMSYDRYIAICRPLHYIQVMGWQTCVHLAVAVWMLGMLYSLIHTIFTLRLTFCASNVVWSFFCDVSKLLQISCTDTFVNLLSIFILGGLLGLSSLLMTFIPYITVFSTILKIRGKDKRSKAFSTCSSHLTVVFIFYGTLVFNYFRPTTSYYHSADRVVSVFYTLVTPLVNPLVYSLRNQELKAALRRLYKTYRPEGGRQRLQEQRGKRKGPARNNEPI
ncbi:olfactory receptor 5B12-like [Ranitomeya imitator]|uniref:olfactory receptor 5B12-like n=1 Tax=Ranitomeya imitator TaxID=111125 RepID=UPI0037E71AC2